MTDEQSEGLSRRALLNTAGAVGGTVLAATMLSGATPASAQAGTPVAASRFSLSIDGVEIATFGELQGITAEVEATQYWETAGSSPTTSKLAGKQKPMTVVLSRGVTGGLELWAWHEAVRRGQIAAARRNCNLVMFDTTGRAVVRYFLTNAWPAKIELAGLKAGASQVLTETVTLVAENLQRVTP
jgi:phage tail-like protein